MKSVISRLLSALSVSLLFALSAQALSDDQFSREFGDYIVHFNAFNSSVLSPEVARQYQLKRGKNIGILNIAVQKKSADTAMPVAVDAILSGEVKNLLGKSYDLPFKRIQEEQAIYYLSDFRVTGDDVLRFDILIKTSAEDRGYKLSFEKAMLAQ